MTPGAGNLGPWGAAASAARGRLHGRCPAANRLKWVLASVRHCCIQYGTVRYVTRRWDKKIENLKPWDNGEVRVGIMGFGVMGQASAQLLRAAGYQVAAWARTPRAAHGGGGFDGVAMYAGRDSLRPFVERTDILICLLPLTSETQGALRSAAAGAGGSQPTSGAARAAVGWVRGCGDGVWDSVPVHGWESQTPWL